MEERQQLTSQETQKLFDFVRSKYVPYKDVQYEIVDHLASGIEELQAQDPGLSFEKALTNIYSRFPITGFATLQLEKEKYIKQYWRRRFGTFMLKFFQIPRIILTIILFVSFYKLFNAYGYYSMLFIGWSWFLVMVYSRFRNKWISKHEENYLVVKSFLSSIGFYVLFVFVVFYFLTILVRPDQYSTYPEGLLNFVNYFVAFTFALAYIFTYGSFKIFPDMLKEEIKKKYQHLHLAI